MSNDSNESPSLLDSLRRYNYKAYKNGLTNSAENSKSASNVKDDIEKHTEKRSKDINNIDEPCDDSNSENSTNSEAQSLQGVRLKRMRIPVDSSDCDESDSIQLNRHDIKRDKHELDSSDDGENIIIVKSRKKRLKLEDDSNEDDSTASKKYESNRLAEESKHKIQSTLLSFFNKSATKVEDNVKRNGKSEEKVGNYAMEEERVAESEEDIALKEDGCIDKNELLEKIRKNFSRQTMNSHKLKENENSDAKKEIIPVGRFYTKPQPDDVGQGKPKVTENSSGKLKKVRKKKRRKDFSDSEEESVIQGQVYDSDADSDEELPDVVSGIKARVLEFLNTAPEKELSEVKCSQKKIQAVISSRPFSGWRQLVKACESNKGIGTEILNATQQLLTARDVLSSLMTRCQKIAKRTEDVVADGVTNIVKQPSDIPPEMKLKSYQMVGLNWLAVMHSQGLSGILADEMGLGKTIQVIAFLAYLKEQGLAESKKPHLIVVPASTLENWMNEFEIWCPGMLIAQYYGSQEERRQIRYEWVKHGFGEIEVVISTYHIVAGHNYEERKMFRIMKMQYAIFDEGHMLKNMTTQRYDNLSRINAEHKILLTGTPIQNNLLELMSLLVFVMPDIIGQKMDYIKFLFDRKKAKTAQEKVKFENDNIELAKKIMKPFILRRLKADVLKDLPNKTSTVMECPMLESQQKRYTALKKEFKENVGSESCHIGMVMDLRKIANHPLTLRHFFTDDQVTEMATRLVNDPFYKEKNVDNVCEDLLFMSDLQLHKMTKTYKCISRFHLPDKVFLESGKFAKLDELLPDLQADGHRLLIFSQFCFILDLLEEYMRIQGYKFLRFDGSTPVLERQQLIDKFNDDDDIFVFLLTTKSGGMGINLTSADTVIIHDVDFNPYNDIQAEDRVHRMGQTRDVNIIRLISKGTIEEMIWTVAQEKTKLGKEVTSVKENEAEENKNMVSLLRTALGFTS